MKILLFNKQTLFKPSLKILEKLAYRILEEENISTDEVHIYFISDKDMKRMHKKYFNKGTSTDCISFPIDSPDEKASPHILGEIFICPQAAYKYAKKNNIDPVKEIYLYVIHGILHIIGYDDIEEKDKKIMKEKENKYLCLIT